MIPRLGHFGSLAAVSSLESTNEQLQQIADPGVQASLGHVGKAKLDHDAMATTGPELIAEARPESWLFHRRRTLPACVS